MNPVKVNTLDPGDVSGTVIPAKNEWLFYSFTEKIM